jgi:hypothetical protein
MAYPQIRSETLTKKLPTGLSRSSDSASWRVISPEITQSTLQVHNFTGDYPYLTMYSSIITLSLPDVH